ncbi:MAG: ATP-binding cassette domain-containing protein [Magnetococcales bacterium]|nr:ATP-binding cassette domain-containing protein [Magnetococcales bacterium]
MHNIPAGESLDVPFGLFCVSVIVNFTYNKKFIVFILNSSFDAMTSWRQEWIRRLAMGSYQTLQNISADHSPEMAERYLQLIATVLPNISVAANMFFVAVSAYIYFLSVSPQAGLIIMITLIGMNLFYIRQLRTTRSVLAEAKTIESQMAHDLNDILQGNAEIKLGKAKRDQIITFLNAVNDNWHQRRHQYGVNFGNEFSFITISMILIAAMTIFVLPKFHILPINELPNILAVLLFLIRPMAKFLNAVPDFLAAEDAARRLIDFNDWLPESEFTPSNFGYAPRHIHWIELDGVTFVYQSYDGQSPFSVGPFSFRIRAGSVFGIFGPNGSGKSTLLLLVPLLLTPLTGVVKLDGHVITSERLENYRDLFGSIFQNHHVFLRLPEGDSFDDELFCDMLTLLEISTLITITSDRRIQYHLSKGQERRLALAVAVAEGRQILILDEWTADQDQLFRSRFRNELLAKLRALGRTVIFVSHDEQAFELCDDYLVLQNGRVSRLHSASGI